MTWGAILLILLVFSLAGSFYPYRRAPTWGYAPGGLIGFLLLVLLIAVVFGGVQIYQPAPPRGPVVVP